MEEQTLCLTGKEAPHSHCTGKVAIVGTYATPGIICTNSYLFPHCTGVGNHQFQLHNFDAHTVLGTDYPKTVHPQVRALHCGLERTVKWYNKVLTKLLIRHRSFEKLDFLQTNHHLMSADAFQTLFNTRWDMEVTQLMLASEKWCNKFCDRSIEFSPITGIWIHCLPAYRWIQQFHENKVAHGGNLFQTCRRLSIISPLVLTPTQVLPNVNECITWLEGLKKDAPKLQNAHLCKGQSLAQVREDTALVIAIQKILHAESICCQLRLIQWAANPFRGDAVTWLTVPHPAGDTLYVTRRLWSLGGQQQLKRGTKWHGGLPFCKMSGCTATLNSWQTLSWQIRSCRAHMSTLRTGIHIPNSCYRRYNTSSTDS
jgi:hypothetical protein